MPHLRPRASRPSVPAFLLASALYCCAQAAPVIAGVTTLAWDPSTDARVAGYTVHYGSAGNALSNAVNVGTTTRFTVTNLADGSSNAFAVSAYDANGNHSPYSNVVVATASASGASVASPSGTGILPYSGSVVDDRGAVFTLAGAPTSWGGTSVLRNGATAWNWAGNECLWFEHQFYCVAGTRWWLQDRDTGAGYVVPDPLGQPSANGTVIRPASGSIVDDDGNVYTLYGSPNSWGGTAVYRNGTPAWNWAGTECLWWYGFLYCHAPSSWWRQDPGNGSGTPVSDPRG